MGSFGDDFGGGFGGQGFGGPNNGSGGQDFGGQNFGGQDFGGDEEYVSGRSKKEKKSSRRKNKSDAEMYGNEGNFDMGGVGGGSFGNGGFDAGSQDLRPSAIGESLGQVPSHGRGGDNYGNYSDNYGARGNSDNYGARGNSDNYGARGNSDNYGARGTSSASAYSGRHGELGMGDDFRNRDQGFNDPAERRDFGYVERDPTAGSGGGLEPVRRGFSFNFNDIPKVSHNEPRYDGSSSRPEAPRWNPFEGLRRNWETTREEASIVHTEPVQVHGPGMYAHMASHPALASSALPPGRPGGVPGTLENELFKTEERVAALRTKLGRLEADMVHGSQSPVSGHLRLAVTHLVAGGHLGIRMRGAVVAEVVNPEAREFGWFVGDQVLKVNGYQVQNEPEFAREVAKAMDGYRMTGRPLVFDVFRQSETGMMGAVPPPGGKGGAFMGQDPQLQRLAAENYQLRQDMIGQSMTMNGPPNSMGGMIGQSMTMNGPPNSMGGMQPPTMASLPPTAASFMTVPPSMGMMPPSYPSMTTRIMT